MAASGILQTEYAFSLPCGYVDDQGNLHRDGVMRLATALDEVEPLGDGRVQSNQAYLSVLLLARVVTRIGNLSPITPSIVEKLFSADFAYLQDLYVQVNDLENTLIETQCPDCGSRFTLDTAEDSRG